LQKAIEASKQDGQDGGDDEDLYGDPADPDEEFEKTPGFKAIVD
jgi:hypothetical protein